jgi:hypothetical protein
MRREPSAPDRHVPLLPAAIPAMVPPDPYPGPAHGRRRSRAPRAPDRADCAAWDRRHGN